MIVRVKRSVFYRVFHSNKEMIKLYLQGCVPMHFYDCPDIASLESWGNFYIYKVFILNIKFCFTCSEWKLYYNFVKFSNIMKCCLKNYFATFISKNDSYLWLQCYFDSDKDNLSKMLPPAKNERETQFLI